MQILSAEVADGILPDAAEYFLKNNLEAAAAVATIFIGVRYNIIPVTHRRA